MVSISWIVRASVCLLVHLACCRTVRKDFEITLNLLGKRPLLYSNEVVLFDYLRSVKSRPQDQKKGLAAPPVTRDCFTHTTEIRTGPSFDIYRIGDLKFSIPTRTSTGVLKRKVLAECGFLLGLSDFKRIPPFDASESSPDVSEVWFRWNNLRAKCELSTVIEGLKDGTGEMDVLVKPLYMLLRLRLADPSSSNMEMTTSKEATVRVRGLDTLSGEQQNAIRAEIESRIICIVNVDVRNVLMENVKSSLQTGSTSPLTKQIYNN